MITFTVFPGVTHTERADELDAARSGGAPLWEIARVQGWRADPPAAGAVRIHAQPDCSPQATATSLDAPGLDVHCCTCMNAVGARPLSDVIHFWTWITTMHLHQTPEGRLDGHVAALFDAWKFLVDIPLTLPECRAWAKGLIEREAAALTLSAQVPLDGPHDWLLAPSSLPATRGSFATTRRAQLAVATPVVLTKWWRIISAPARETEIRAAWDALPLVDRLGPVTGNESPDLWPLVHQLSETHDPRDAFAIAQVTLG